MSNNYDRFGDVVQQVAGIFGADTPAMDNGLADFDAAPTVADSEGVHITMRCRGCGGSRNITAEWPEIMCIARGISPHEVISGMTPWQYSQVGRGWYPLIACSGCSTPVVPLVPMQEAQQHLKTGSEHKWPWFQSQAPYQLDAVIKQALAARR